MRIITDDEIKDILFQHETLLSNIQKRVKKLYQDMDTANGLIRCASMGSTSGEITTLGSDDKRDLSDVFFRYQKLIEEQEVEVRIGLIRLVEEQEAINRVLVCYRSLPGVEYTLITELYVAKKLYRIVEKESGMNHRQFEKIRKRALARIRTLYTSHYSNIEIAAQKESRYEQLRLKLE